jgi:hypothetical protein
MASMFRQGYTHAAPNFSMSNLGSAPYTSGYNGRAYPNPNGNYPAPYTTVAYTDPLPLSDSSLGFLPNHPYQNMPHFNTYDQPEADGFDFETPPQFPFRLQPIDMTPPRAMAEPDADHNKLTNQLATILRESVGIEPKGRGCVDQKPYPDYYDQLPYPRGYSVPEFSKFSGRMVKPH